MKHIIVKKCGQCPANSAPLCLADMDLDCKVTEEGFPDDCPLEEYKTKWNKTKEGLPELNAYVIVSNGKTVWPSHRGITDDGWMWYNDGGVSEKEDVTLWMEFPTPA